MSRIPIKAVKQLGQDTGQDIVIVYGLEPDGTENVATWGRTIDDCSRAADWGNKLKDKLGWPESLHQQPSRVRKLQQKVKELEAALMELKKEAE